MFFFGLRRLAAVVGVVWLAVTVAFIALRWMPGDAIDATLVRAGASTEEAEARREALGLNDPLWEQYYRYWRDLATGDWGASLISGQAVREMIAQNALPTATLAGSALLVGVGLGVGLGVISGAGRWGAFSLASDLLSALALSTPVYWTATLAIYLFTIVWDVLPGVGGTGPRYLILPAMILGFHTAGGISRVTASSVRQAAQADFVRTARAKGLPAYRVLEHILRVGLLPVIAVVALELGFLLGGTVITEIIFVRRGLGRLMLDAVNTRDYPVIQGLVVLSALVYGFAGLLADWLYWLVDPRVGEERVR